MADSKFYDAAVKDGLSVYDYVKSRFPQRVDLLELKPVDQDTHKGYFPAGKITAIFGTKDTFNNWKKAILKIQPNSGRSFIDCVIHRLVGQGKQRHVK